MAVTTIDKTTIAAIEDHEELATLAADLGALAAYTKALAAAARNAVYENGIPQAREAADLARKVADANLAVPAEITWGSE